jgi:uncharacterized protein (TIGR01777 family)
VNDQRFVRRTRLEVPAERAFAWHARPGAFERLTPPWEHVEVVERTGGGVEPGARVVVLARVGPFRRRWVALHGARETGRSFSDEQVEGPFASWRHTHAFLPDGPRACILEDRIDYRLPFGALGRLIAGRAVRRRLERLFEHRHRITARDLEGVEAGSMRILVSGSTGLVGGALVPALTSQGHEVARLVRPSSRAPGGGAAVSWDPEAGRIDAAALEGIDAVVHLAGESIAARRWSEAQKARIRDSRVKGPRLRAEALAKLQHRPRVLVSASAIGFYGDRRDEIVREESASGGGFLAEVCRAWEAAARPAEDAGIRVVFLRSGMILSPKGGALAKILTPFKLGAGGPIGNGRQWMSWITVEDEVGAIRHALAQEGLRGPVNCVSPRPVTNHAFTKSLGRALHRPTIFPMPAFAARLAFGEMADELLLSSTRVEPGRLLATGYSFAHPDLDTAFRLIL